ncbi:MAG: GNAT family N-acetyltransferase [Hyphomicrobiaceae bacterium]|nr:GNAT family N-acetyltransferase [Hyphomicrobiaceae bacterium]
MSALEREVSPGGLPLSITTQRLVLRRPRLDDAPRYAELLNNFAVAGNLARVPLPFTVDHTREWLPEKTRTLNPREFGFAITTPQDGLIGNIGFHEGRFGPDIGYWLGEPYWGQGLMTEAIRATVAWFFDNTGEDTLYSGVFHFNMASLAIQFKLGFVETGRSQIYCQAREREVEHIDTELSREDFEASRR